MKKKQQKKFSKGVLYVALILFAGMFQTSCLDEIVPGNYYTFTGETIADYLENRDSIFSDYIYCLKEAGRWGEMSSYGDYTCFAPTNSSFQTIYDEWGVANIEELATKIDEYRALPESDPNFYRDQKNDLLDTIALTHLCAHTFFCSDLIDGALPYPNMLDRYLIYTTGELFDIGTEGDTLDRNVAYFINKTSRIVQRDDTVQNGVVHIMTDIVKPSNNTLADQIKLDDNLNIFSMILTETSLAESPLSDAYIDPDYPTLSTDSTVYGDRNPIYHIGEEEENVIFPETRKILYTVFAVPDSVMVQEINSTLGSSYTEEEIIENPSIAYEYAKTHYEYLGETYSESDYADRKNPLNRFMSYHILPVRLSYNTFHWGRGDQDEATKIRDNHVAWDSLDIEDFYETYMPHSIMRISTAKTTGEPVVYINRKGIQGRNDRYELTHIGSKVYKPTDSDSEQDALNGEYHYIDKPLIYSDDVRNGALNTRLRFMCESLSPDFINSGARRVTPWSSTGGYAYSFLDGFCKNFELSQSTGMLVRSSDETKTIPRGEEINFVDDYDIIVTLPPVPFTGTYEIRLFMNTLAGNDIDSDRGVIQIYFGEDDNYPTKKENLHPCGIPIDMTIAVQDPRIGGVLDEDLRKEGGEEAIIANDKAMRNRGYMKGMAFYAAQNKQLNSRDDEGCMRKILTTEYIEDDKTYKLRIRLVGGEKGVCPFGVLEIVPKTIYANPNLPEDRL